MREYGWNDDKNNVFCGFCAWTQHCKKGIEEIEFRLNQHLKEVHGKRSLFRREDKSGKINEIL